MFLLSDFDELEIFSRLNIYLGACKSSDSYIDYEGEFHIDQGLTHVAFLKIVEKIRDVYSDNWSFDF